MDEIYENDELEPILLDCFFVQKPYWHSKSSSSMEYFIAIASLLALTILGWFIYKQQAYRIPNPIEAEGEVVDIEHVALLGINPLDMMQGKGGTSVKYHPIVRFNLDKEKRVRFRNRKGYKSEDKYLVGDKVPILYSKDNPLVAKIKD